eukprot:scaffold13738_cov176-Skeletonema_dohrnii-CCMP3373.AAC.1
MSNERTPININASVVGVSVHALHSLENNLNAVQENASDNNASPPLHKRIWSKCQSIYGTHSFLIKALILILIAFAYPPLGATYLAPQITATWIAVIFIFILAGMGIKTEEFAKAFQRLPFNLFVQLFNFGVVSSIVFGFSRLMVSVNALTQSLADGMTICASLPITINMVLVLTKSAGGDEAAAIFNAAFGNLVGIFLSPALILGYLGVTGEVNMGQVFFKLGLRVVLPIFIGQILQHFVPPAKEFVKQYKKYFKTAQECCLLFIIYTVFCKTFLQGMEAGGKLLGCMTSLYILSFFFCHLHISSHLYPLHAVGQIFLMIALQFFMLCVVMVLAWTCLRVLFRNEPKLQAMGLFGCTHKTVAMGVPLINAIYESNPMVGLYTLPLLIWHPMQLVVGSFVAPYVAAYVQRREEEISSTLQEEKSEDGTTSGGPDETTIQDEMEQGVVEDKADSS